MDEELFLRIRLSEPVAACQLVLFALVDGEPLAECVRTGHRSSLSFDKDLVLDLISLRPFFVPFGLVESHTKRVCIVSPYVRPRIVSSVLDTSGTIHHEAVLHKVIDRYFSRIEFSGVTIFPRSDMTGDPFHDTLCWLRSSEHSPAKQVFWTCKIGKSRWFYDISQRSFVLQPVSGSVFVPTRHVVEVPASEQVGILQALSSPDHRVSFSWPSLHHETMLIQSSSTLLVAGDAERARSLANGCFSGGSASVLLLLDRPEEEEEGASMEDLLFSDLVVTTYSFLRQAHSGGEGRASSRVRSDFVTRRPFSKMAPNPFHVLWARVCFDSLHDHVARRERQVPTHVAHRAQHASGGCCARSRCETIPRRGWGRSSIPERRAAKRRG